MRGRKPTPTSLRVKRGNPAKRSFNTTEPLPPVEVPECPAELSDAAKEEWERLVHDLARLNMLTSFDRAALAAYCEAYAMWLDAVTNVRRFGSMVKSPSGYPMQSPYVAMVNKQAEIMIRIASEFGFTPASRSRISAPPEPMPTLFDLIEHEPDGEA